MPRNPNCNLCKLCNGVRTVCVWGEGITPCDIMIIERDPGEQEDIQGRPFVGDSGKLLNEFLSVAGLQRNHVFIDNITKCRPPGNRNTFPEERKACRPYLIENIKAVKPKFIITLGGDALEELTGQTQVMKLAGTSFDFKNDIFESKILVSVHPSYVVRNGSYKPQVLKHFENFGKIIRGEEINKDKSLVKYIFIKTFEQFNNFIEKLKVQKQVVIDLETTGLNFLTDKILCMSFSWKENTAVVLPLLKEKRQEFWTAEEYSQIIIKLKEVFGNPNIEWIAHNVSFDAKFLKTYDLNIAGSIHDTMLLITLIDENATDLKGLKPLAELYTDLGKYDKEIDDYVFDMKEKQRQELFDKKKTVKDEIKKLTKISKKATKEDLLALKQKIGDLEFELEELEEIKIEVSYAEITPEVLWKYSATDADATMRLFNLFTKKLQEASNSLVRPYGKSMVKLYSKLIMPLRKVLNDMEYRGAALNIPYLQELDKKYTIAEGELEKELLEMDAINVTEKVLYRKAAEKVRNRFKELKNPKLVEEDYVKKHTVQPDFNINSPDHLRALLFETLKLPILKNGKPSKKDGTVKPSTDKEVLEEYEDAHPCIKKLVANRKLQKLHKTYVKGMQKHADSNKRIHTNFNQHVTVTGRLSSSNPVNLQNIPRKDKDIKRAFITYPGWSIVQNDCSQAEFRQWAQLSNDQDMIQDLRAGLDIHRRTASEFWGIPEDQVSDEQRSQAKFVVFGLMYGRGAKSVAKQVGIAHEEALQIIKNFFAKYPVAARWLEATKQFAKTRKYVINHFGRVRRLPKVMSNMQEEVAEAMRQAVNAPIQGGAADVTGIGLIRIHKEIAKRNLSARLILTVHDSIILECPNEEIIEVAKLCHKCMTDPITGIIVPMEVEVEVGRNWAEVKKWNINKIDEYYKEYIEGYKNEDSNEVRRAS